MPQRLVGDLIGETRRWHRSGTDPKFTGPAAEIPQHKLDTAAGGALDLKDPTTTIKTPIKGIHEQEVDCRNAAGLQPQSSENLVARLSRRSVVRKDVFQ